jgi:hypothetical protein
MYQQRKVFGRSGFPFTGGLYRGEVDYSPGICPVVERMYDRELIIGDFCRYPLTSDDMTDIAEAFQKVLLHTDELREWERGNAEVRSEANEIL